MDMSATEITKEEKVSSREFVNSNKQSAVYLFVKRFFDVLLSVIGLVLLSPVFLVIAIAIFAEDGQPVIFKQERSGLDGKAFCMYKFRSMCKDAELMHAALVPLNELDGPAFKMKNDPRLTKVGKVLRRTSLDELPQLVNIIKGEMSIVGPRPLPVYETEQCTSYQKQRLQVKPGLTCYWQVSGRNDIPFEEWMALDMKYIEEAGILTDVKIIIKTAAAVMGGGRSLLEKHSVHITQNTFYLFEEVYV